MSANDRQVGGKHYGGGSQQHWDIVAAFKLDYFQGQITKYVMRWRDKGGVQDLEKARHFLDKYIELNQKKVDPEVRGIEYHAERNFKIDEATQQGADIGLIGKEQLPAGWTIEGYLIRSGKPVQVYKHKCGSEIIAMNVLAATLQHVCPTHRVPNSDASRGLSDRPEPADQGGATGAYTNQG